MNKEESFRIIKMLLPEFKERLYENFDKTFPMGWRYGIEDIDGHEFWAIASTVGYGNALEETLKSFPGDAPLEVWNFYNELPWNESDDWDWDLEVLLDNLVFKKVEGEKNE